jgi:hypothetical protein
MSNFGRRVLQMVFEASILAACACGGVYQGVILDICHICVELPMA